MKVIISADEGETKKLGRYLASKLKGGDILLLSGDLGAGKTVFVKGLANGLGLKNNIRSPSFNLIKVYSVKNKKAGIKNLAHLDCYRLSNPREVIDSGLLDYLGKKDTLVAIEWPEKISRLLKKFKTKKIKFEYKGKNERKIIK